MVCMMMDTDDTMMMSSPTATPGGGKHNSSSSNHRVPDTKLQAECLELFREKQYSSCQLLAQLDLSMHNSSNNDNNEFSLCILADCAFEEGNYHQALEYYRSCGLYSDFFRYKEALCLQQLGSFVEAASLIEAMNDDTNANNRTFSMNMTLASLYLSISRTNDACQVYLECLRQNPHALEAIVRATELTDRQIVLQNIHEGLLARSSNSNSVEVPDYLRDFVTASAATSSKYRHEAAATLQSWPSRLEHSTYGHNNFFLAQKAKLQLYVDDQAGARISYELLLQRDPTSVTDMDRYGLVLANVGELDRLNRLAQTLLARSDQHPEAWVVLALYHHASQDQEKAQAFCEKALSLRQRHSLAHRLQGTILLADQSVEHAAVSFFRANELEPDVASFQGLVDSYISAGKYKEALAAAKEAISLAPRDVRALTLVGLALARGASSVNNSNNDMNISGINHHNNSNSNNIGSQQGMEKAKRTLTKALSMDPTCVRALSCLVEIYFMQREYHTCIKLLKDGLEGTSGSLGSNETNAPSSSKTSTSSSASQQQQHHPQRDMILTKLGQVYAHMENYKLAIECFHQALAISNETNSEAKMLLEQTERILAGDEEEEDDDSVGGDNHHHQGDHDAAAAEASPARADYY